MTDRRPILIANSTEVSWWRAQVLADAAGTSLQFLESRGMSNRLAVHRLQDGHTDRWLSDFEEEQEFDNGFA